MHYTARTEGLRAPGERHAADGWSCARSSGGGRDASGGIGKAVWAGWAIPGGKVGGPTRVQSRGPRGKRANVEAPAVGACGKA